MSKTASLTVTLPESLTDFVRERVDAGRYASSSQVVEEALVLLQTREAERQAVIERIRREIEEGAKQAEAGLLRDGEEVFKELFERHRLRS